jgi:hypothetical protein
MTLANRQYQLSLPVLKAFLEVEAKDKRGLTIHKISGESHSWVRNAYNHLFSQMAAVNCLSADGLSVRDIGGTFRSGNWPVGYSDYSLNFKTDNHGYKAAAADTTRGIVVGTGSDPEDFDDYALGSQIANGTGAGLLSYIASEVYTISTVGTVKKNELVRYFNNNSGGAITVNEVGLYLGLWAGNTIKVMTCRDLISGGVEVPDTGQLKVTYTIQLTYPV